MSEHVEAPNKAEYRLNEEITCSSVRVIGSDGQMIGVFSPGEALNIAYREELDLVEISPNAVPPVCKILDYGKFRYEMQKKEKEANKKQKKVETKEIKFHVNIGENDLMTKLRHMRDFLNDGNKVKVTLEFRGREVAHTELGANLLNRIQELVTEGHVNQTPSLREREMTMMFIPGPAPVPPMGMRR